MSVCGYGCEIDVYLNSKKMRKSLFLAGLVLLLLIVSGCPNSSRLETGEPGTNLLDHPLYSTYKFTDDDSVIRIGVQPLYIPTGLITETISRDLILGEALSGLGMRIEYYPFLKGYDVNFFLKQNLLEIGIGGDMPAISAAVNMDITIPILVQQGFSSIVASKPMLTQDMKGKRIAFPYGSISHYSLLNILNGSGLTESDVFLLPMEVNTLQDALENGKIDAFSAWEPVPATVLKRNPEFSVAAQSYTTGYMYFLADFAADHGQAMRHILAAVVRSLRWLRNDKNHLLEACRWNLRTNESITGEQSDLSENEMADLAYRDILQMYGAPFIPEKTLQVDGNLHREFRFLRELNKIPANSDWDRVRRNFDAKTLLEIVTHPEEYRLYETDYSGIEP